MIDKQVWRDYKKTVLEKVQDFSSFFPNLKNEKEGSDGWVTACCAFHDDRHPSFAYNRKTGQWACFAGCGKGGPFDYLMQTTGSSFKDALVSLGDKLGVPRPSMNGDKPDQISESYIHKMVNALEENERARKYLREKRGFTDETIRAAHLGWDALRGRIAIPVRDEKGWLVNVRFYSPSKQPKMINLKGHGNTPRLYGADELAKYEGRQVILCEGEFDRLILNQNGFTAVTSTHGCSSFRKEWLPFFKGKDVVIIYDCDDEGQAAVAGVVLRALKESEASSVKNIRLPLAGTKDDKDVTDFFTKPRSINDDLLEKRCYTPQELQKLIDDTPATDFSSSIEDGSKQGDKPNLLLVINSIRNAEGMKTHERHVAISETVANHLSRCGAFFYDPKLSAEYLCMNGQVQTVGNNRLFNSLLQGLGQLNVTTSEGRFVWEFIRNYARSKGKPVQSASWVLGDPAKRAIYVHTHDDLGRILKITPGAIQLIPNGQNEDSVMLSPSDRVKPFQYIENADPAKGWDQFKSLIFQSFPCRRTDQALLSSLVPLIFLKDFCPAKPLIRLSGGTNSGKTTAGKLIGYLIYGEDIAKTGTISSFYTDASKNPLAMLDNLEVCNIKNELLDFLLTGATGIVHEKKKLYTDQDIVRERAASFILTTGIESLGKPELLSRQWEIVCGETFHSPNFSFNAAQLAIVENRDVILSAIFKLLAQEILPGLARRQEMESYLKREFRGHPKNRTFECLAVAFLIWDALESRLGIERDLWADWLKSQRAESEETSAETNVVLQFLNLFAGAIRALQRTTKEKSKEEFLEKYQILPKEEDDGGICFEAGAGQILHVFTALAKQHGYQRPFENAKQLMARLKEALPVIQAAGWRIDLQVRKSHGDRIHRFYLASEGEKQGALPGVND